MQSVSTAATDVVANVDDLGLIEALLRRAAPMAMVATYIKFRLKPIPNT
ncbi:hypothetical protein RRSWK_02279 [Rhodopirellula sp. SWK7]|nr:hypothetical protein RRSWK_02279 [Rhodopirellula sp. SWK7]